MSMQFSVLMSLYIKEKPEYARACFDSLLNQTVLADEWVIVEDGSLTDELYALLDEYENNQPGLIKRVQLKENQKLGKALREGMLHCTYEIITRKDTDDIAGKDRFEKQIVLFIVTIVPNKVRRFIFENMLRGGILKSLLATIAYKKSNYHSYPPTEMGCVA